jgi:Tfp pilus assembly protein PilO
MKNNLIGFLLIVGALTIGFGLLAPKIDEVRALSIEQRALKQLLASKKQRKAALQQLTTIFTGKEDQIRAIMATLPQDPQIPDVLVSAEAMIRESNVGITSITPQINPTQQQVYLVLAGQGGLGNIEALMTKIGENNRPMSVSAVSLTKVDNTIGFNIGITLPYVAQSKPVTPGAAAGNEAAVAGI